MIDRRRFLEATAVATASAALFPLRALAHHERLVHHENLAATTLSKDATAALDASGLVYVSPLKSNGEESTCHGEVWFGWIDGAVVLITGSDRWKARSVKAGLDRARIWVGDYGRWKKWIGKNEGFRQAPSFDATATIVKDEPLLEQLLALYEKKYPEEIAEWRDKMRSGFHDGSRVLIRYVPTSASGAPART